MQSHVCDMVPVLGGVEEQRSVRDWVLLLQPHLSSHPQACPHVLLAVPTFPTTTFSPSLAILLVYQTVITG
jgi:hypothetical protein